VPCYQSSSLGSDTQIAELVLNRRCHKVIFFENPHGARQHEADIQLLERAVASASRATTCFNTPAMAGRWAQAARGDENTYDEYPCSQRICLNSMY
jgi:methylglyoxal synthase